MSKRRQFLRASACALALLANGVGALAQERAKTLPPSQGEPQSRERIMIAPVPGGEIPMQEGGLVFGGQGDYGFAFVSSEMSFDSKVVKGAPFTADAVTETVQALADGNHITRTTSTRLFRDSEGRTRREQSLNGIGTWATNDNAPQAIFINDPVAGVNYVLNTKTHTAQKAMQFFFTRGGEGEPSQGVWKSGEKVVVNSGGAPKQLQIDGGTISGKAIKKVQPDYPPVARAAGAQGEVTVEVVVGEDGNIESAKAISGHPLLQQAAVDAARQWQFKPTTLEGKPVKVRGRISFVFSMEKDQPGAGAATDTSAAAHERAVAERAAVERGVQQKFQQTHESLGKQTVEGVEAEGTRNTITIPAGTIGNERAIQIVSERWYSAELQTVVMTKHSDPRFGETTYRLTNISRGEPDHSLFELPTGYTITDRGSIERRTIMREPQQEP